MRKMQMIPAAILAMSLVSLRALADDCKDSESPMNASSAISVKETPLVVSISAMPMVRVRLNLDHKLYGWHEEVEWDPAQSNGLVRIVRLRGNGGELENWIASMWSEPMTLQTKDGTKFVGFKFNTDEGCDVCGASAVADRSVNYIKSLTEPHIHGVLVDRFDSNATSLQKLTLSITDFSDCNGPTLLRPLAVAPTLVGPTDRALDPVSGIAAELLAVMAEIAVDRAKSGAFDLVAEQLRNAVCHDLVWTDDLTLKLGVHGIAMTENTPIFPRTCKALKHLRVQELSASAKGIYAELVGDLTDLGFTVLGHAAEKVLATDALSNVDPWFRTFIQHPDRIAAMVDEAKDIAEKIQDMDSLLFGDKDRIAILKWFADHARILPTRETPKEVGDLESAFNAFIKSPKNLKELNTLLATAHKHKLFSKWPKEIKTIPTGSTALKELFKEVKKTNILNVVASVKALGTLTADAKQLGFGVAVSRHWKELIAVLTAVDDAFASTQLNALSQKLPPYFEKKGAPLWDLSTTAEDVMPALGRMKQSLDKGTIDQQFVNDAKLFAKFVSDYIDLFPACQKNDKCTPLKKALDNFTGTNFSPTNTTDVATKVKDILTAANGVNLSSELTKQIPNLSDSTKAQDALKTLVGLLQDRVDLILRLRPLASDVQQNGVTIDVLIRHWQELAPALEKLMGFVVQKDLPPLYRGFLQAGQWMPVIQKMGNVVGAAATGSVPVDRAAQVLLNDLALVDWPKMACDSTNAPADACVWACGAQAAFTTLRLCMDRTNGCSPGDLATILPNHLNTSGQSQLQFAGQCRGLQDAIATQWPQLDRVVLGGLEVLRPRANASPKSIGLSTLNVAFELIEQRLCSTPTQKNSPICKDVADVRNMATGLLEDQPHRAILSGADILRRALEVTNDASWKDKNNARNQRKALGKFTTVLGAFTAYAATYATDPKGDPEKQKAAHEARKKALEGLLDATTDRRHRGGDLVVSLGINPGAYVVGRQFELSAITKDKYLVPQLSLPMGIAFQWLPNPKPAQGPTDKPCPWDWGLHLQLSVIDVAQYASYDAAGNVPTPSWSTLFSPGIQLGLMIGKPSSALIIGADARFAPVLGTPDDTKDPDKLRAFRLGGFLSYYVPFFDFN